MPWNIFMNHETPFFALEICVGRKSASSMSWNIFVGEKSISSMPSTN